MFVLLIDVKNIFKSVKCEINLKKLN